MMGISKASKDLWEKVMEDVYHKEDLTIIRGLMIDPDFRDFLCSHYSLHQYQSVGKTYYQLVKLGKPDTALIAWVRDIVVNE